MFKGRRYLRFSEKAFLAHGLFKTILFPKPSLYIFKKSSLNPSVHVPHISILALMTDREENRVSTFKN